MDWFKKYSKGIASLLGSVLMLLVLNFGFDIDVDATVQALMLLIQNAVVIFSPANQE